MSFLTFGSNFSLVVRDCTNFSLFTLNFSLLATYLANFSLLARITHFWPLLQWNSHFSSRISHFSSQPHSHTSRRPSQWHGYYHIIGMFWRAGVRRQTNVCHAGVEKVRNSEWKVRNSCNRAGKVRNSGQKWEIRAFAQEKREIRAKSEKVAWWHNPKWEIRALSET